MNLKGKTFLLILLVMGLGGFFYYSMIVENKMPEAPKPPAAAQSESAQATAQLPAAPPAADTAWDRQMERLLSKTAPKERTLDLPTAPAVAKPPSSPASADAEDAPEPEPKRPPPQHIGVVLDDAVPVYSTHEGWETVCTLQTGDLISPLPDPPLSGRLLIRPRVDVFLAATTRRTESAGRRYPNVTGWVDANKIQILNPEQTVDFTEETDAFTLGDDPNFSMVDFYGRAMKNPDPAVHRIIGARLIALVSLHEDYNSSWLPLIHDPDPRIRSLALSTMRGRGVGKSRLIVDDLIQRTADLTKTRAVGDDETEVLLILEILKSSGHPRVAPALASFREAWAGKQNQTILNELGP